MFRIVCLVEDKQLPKVLHGLAGLVVNMEPPQPVVNATVKKGKVVQASTETTKKGQLIEELVALKGKEITMQKMKDIFVELGGVESSVNSQLTQQLLKAKVLKRKDRGVYQVL